MIRAALAIAIGLALVAWLLASNDLKAIAATVAGAGWGLPLVVALHLPQTLFSALGWGRLIEARVPAMRLFALRWIRESVNALLPVAQIGGEIVRARLLARTGVPIVAASASVVVDLSAEMAAQAVFTLAGVALLLAGPHAGGVTSLTAGAVLGVTGLALVFVLAQRLGLLRVAERLLARRAASGGWGVEVTGLHDAVLGLYRQPARLAASGGEHLVSWLLGAVETYAAMRVLGIDATLREAAVIEALGQAVRAAGFLIPGALGVQEGGFLLIGALLGVAPPQALALSLVRRIRELALGLPGLIWWRHLAVRTEEPLPR